MFSWGDRYEVNIVPNGKGDLAATCMLVYLTEKVYETWVIYIIFIYDVTQI